MKKFFNLFFVILGVLFLILILVLGYLFVIDPFHLKPLFINTATPTPVERSEISATSGADENSATATPAVTSPSLSPAQADALESVGLSPTVIPTFTADQLQCFEEILGVTRVNEIKAGDTPSVAEFYKAKVCIEVQE